MASLTFQLKNFVSIVASMMNRMKATQTSITDFNVGAVGRTLLEAPAMEIEELYQQAFDLVTAAIPVAVYNSFNFSALPALYASGLIRVTIASQTTPTLIAAGTKFTSSSTSVAYVSSSDVTIPAGSTYADVNAAANTIGSAGNLQQGTEFDSSPAIQGFVSATNQAAFVNGRDSETPDSRKQRFNDYISTLPRGTVASILYGLSTASLTDSSGNITEQVRLMQVDEPYTRDETQPIALVNTYIHNGLGSTSSPLMAMAQKIINGYTNTDGTKVPGYKAAGIPCPVYLATEQPLNVAAAIELVENADWDTVKAAATTAISNYLLSLDLNMPAQFSQIVAILRNLSGVADVTVTAPTANVAAGIGVKIMPGTLTFTQAS